MESPKSDAQVWTEFFEDNFLWVAAVFLIGCCLVGGVKCELSHGPSDTTTKEPAHAD